jgi:hypothetical protein
LGPVFQEALEQGEIKKIFGGIIGEKETQLVKFPHGALPVHVKPPQKF